MSLGNAYGVCGCGLLLYELLCNKTGKRIGVTHTSEDEDYHLNYWASIRAVYDPESDE